MDTSIAGRCAQLRKADTGRFELPLVSIVVINYNYGRFLLQAVDSVFEQTYPDIECIIVDNASTDESPAVLSEIERKYPGATIMRRPDNGGQSLATIEGFSASSGEYVVFLDADDFLLPSFVETHIFVHLSLRIPVGLTSADMIQAVDSRMVLGTYFSLGEYVRSGRGKRPDLLRRIDDGAPEAWPLGRPDRGIADLVHFVEPCDVGSWYWAPTSGNCFRRDALRLFLANDALKDLRSCTDSYLIRGISVLTGSVLIDRSLAVYRLHGLNVFSKHPHLNGIVSYERGGQSDNDQLGRKMVIDHLVDNAPFFLRKLYSHHHYVHALKALEEAWPPLPSSVAGFRSYLSARVASRLSVLLRELGWSCCLVVFVWIKPKPKKPAMATPGLSTCLGLVTRFRFGRDCLVKSFLMLAMRKRV